MAQKFSKMFKPGADGQDSIGMRVLKILYIVLFATSALIVLAYVFFTFGIRTPTVDDPPVTTSPGQTIVDNVGEDKDKDKVEEPVVLERREQVYTCLIFGLDAGNGNTDTIMVATFDVPNKTIGLMSIPRDTVVSEEYSIAFNKVNGVYARDRVDGLKEEVSELLGIPIDYYVKVRLSAFEKLVNAIGGVWFDVPIDMNYDDPTQNLSIHLQKGYQLLNGEQAMGLVRYRQDNNNEGYGDIGRAGTQQKFMKAMLSQVLSNASLDTIPDLVDILLNYVETDAGINDMLYFGRAALGVDLNNALSMKTLPSQWHYPYMWVESEKALEVINQLLNPYTTEITEEMVEFLAQ